MQELRLQSWKGPPLVSMPHNPIPLANSILGVSPSKIRELANIAFGMDGVLRLYFGESNAPTPPFIKDAAITALQEGYTFYTHNAGLQAFARRLLINIKNFIQSI